MGSEYRTTKLGLLSLCVNQLTSDCDLCVVGGGWGGVLVAGNTSVSSSICIANTLSGEHQCAGHLGREGEGGGGRG